MNQSNEAASHSGQSIGNQQSKSSDTTTEATIFHTEFDAAMAFYQECAERVGMGLKDWLESEPF